MRARILPIRILVGEGKTQCCRWRSAGVRRLRINTETEGSQRSTSKCSLRYSYICVIQKVSIRHLSKRNKAHHHHELIRYQPIA